MVRTFSKLGVSLLVTIALAFSSIEAGAQQSPSCDVGSAVMGGLIGGLLGLAGSKGNAGAGVAGAMIGGVAGCILQSLTDAEKAKREAALKAAAKTGQSSWASKGETPKKAVYKKVGMMESVGGKKCQKVQETITLPDGQKGTSVENVCFDS
jgi:predicted lipid-binding transport protein (Tim44 family)